MGQAACCSQREKGTFVGGSKHRRFAYDVIPVDLSPATLLSISPLYVPSQSSSSAKKEVPRRIAVGNETEVRVFQLRKDVDEDGDVNGPPILELEATASCISGMRFSSLHFVDDLRPRLLAAGLACADDRGQRDKTQPCIVIWDCDDCGSKARDSDCETECLSLSVAMELSGLSPPVTHLAATSLYFVAADGAGGCGVWNKKTGFQMHGCNMLHEGGVADMAVDKQYVYSAGAQDCRIAISAISDLSLIQEINLSCTSSFKGVTLYDGRAPNNGDKATGDLEVAQITAARRPLSRWTAVQRNSNNKGPSGLLFVAAVRRLPNDPYDDGTGILMEWHLSERPTCIAACIAHDGPIKALAFGPYDNGPLITADGLGGVSIWDWGIMMQRAQLVRLSQASTCGLVSFAVEPQCGFYSVSGGDTLCVWRQQSGGVDDRDDDSYHTGRSCDK